MKNRFTEGTIIFITIVKWISLAILSGLLVGSTAAGFLKILGWVIEDVTAYHYYYVLLPLALLVSAWLVQHFAKNAEGHGTEKVIEAIHLTEGKIGWKVIPVKLLATIITLAFGGSAGKEGPTAQIGAGITSLFSQLIHLSSADRKKLVICGISAGFAAVFGLPISGAIFGVEVLFVGSILYDVLLPSFIAGIVSFQVANTMGIHYYHNALNFVPVFSDSFFLFVLISGVYFGLCSLLTIEVFDKTTQIAGKIRLSQPVKGLLGGSVLVLLSLLISTKYLGLGLDTIESNLSGGTVNWYDFLLKIIFTSVTLAFGGSGGVITSVFFIGSCAGCLAGEILHLDTSTFAALGMISMAAGTTNTPIACSVMSIEMFGPQMGVYGAVASVICFLMTGHRSIYPSQVLTMVKSENLRIKLGQSMDKFSDSDLRYRSRDPVFNFILSVLKSFNRKIGGLIHPKQNRH